jgi:hypothetical protein
MNEYRVFLMVGDQWPHTVTQRAANAMDAVMMAHINLSAKYRNTEIQCVRIEPVEDLAGDVEAATTRALSRTEARTPATMRHARRKPQA